MSNDSARPDKRERRELAREHAAERREAERRRQRRRRVVLWSSGAAVVVAIAVVVVLVISAGTTRPAPRAMTASAAAGAAGPEGIPVESGTPLAADTTSSTGATEDGIACNSGEGSVEHIHTHLAVYVDGVLRPVPVGVGIVTPAVQDPGTPDAFAQATRCYYWLHVHASDGIIHVEAPSRSAYTLGQFFAVWRQPLSSTDVAGAKGTQTIFVNGEVVHGDPSAIPLGSREDVQIDVGKVVPFQPVDWSRSQL